MAPLILYRVDELSQFLLYFSNGHHWYVLRNIALHVEILLIKFGIEQALFFGAEFFGDTEPRTAPSANIIKNYVTNTTDTGKYQACLSSYIPICLYYPRGQSSIYYYDNNNHYKECARFTHSFVIH